MIRNFIIPSCIIGLSLTAPCIGQTDVELASVLPRGTANINEVSAATERCRVSLGVLQDEEVDLSTPPSEWRVESNAWVWALGIDGTIGIRGQEVDVSASISDVLEASDSIAAFAGRLEIGKDRWGGFIDGMYADIGIDNATGPLGLADVDITFEQTVLDFGLMYRLGEWEPAGNAARNRRNTTLDVYAGGRYIDLDVEFDPASLPSQSDGFDWVDPIVGTRLVLPFDERWSLRLNGDIGGFGIESDFTWSATGVLEYDFTMFDRPGAVFFGYRAIGWDYTDGSGTDEFTWDVIEHGALLGFSLNF